MALVNQSNKSPRLLSQLRNRPIVVLFVANSARVGGGNRVMMDVMWSVDRMGYRPLLASPGRGPLTEWAKKHGFRAHVVPDGDWNGRVSLARRTAQLSWLMLRNRVRLVHAAAHTCYRAAGVAAAITGARRVCHLGAPPTGAELRWAFQSGPDVVIACHDRQAREVLPTLASLRPSCRVVSVPNGVDLRRFAWTERGRERWRFGARHVVLIPASLSEAKGYSEFLDAASVIHAELLGDCAFVAVGGNGESVYQARLKDRALRLGIGERVHFLGWQDDMPAILSAADVVVLPSYSEGMPLSVLEAMACERPVVATRVGGIPDAVVDGVTGALIDSRNAVQLAERILALLRDPARARAMGRAGRKRARDFFSLDRTTTQVLGIYGQLLNPNKLTRQSDQAS